MNILKKCKKKYYNMLGGMIGGIREDSAQTDSHPMNKNADIYEAGWKSEHLEMMERLLSICDANKIPVFLSGETALCAVRDETLSDYPEICIPEKFFDSFAQLIKDDGDYEVLGLTRNKNNRYSQLIVNNPKTVDYDLDRSANLRCIGLHVKVFAIQSCSKKALLKIKIKTLLKKHLKSAVFKFGDVKRNGKRRNVVLRAISAVAPDKYLINQVRRSLFDGRNDETQRVLVNSISYPKGIFDNRKKARISDRDFFIPNNYEEYLFYTFGSEWRSRKTRYFNEKDTMFRDTNHTAEEYKKAIEYMDYDDYSINKTNLYECVYGEKTARIIQSRYKWLIKRTHERFLLWHKYMPHKETICRLYDNGEMLQLEKLLSEYTQKLREYADRDLTMCFDKKIFEIAMEVMRYKGLGALVKKIRPLVPEEHKKEVVIKDYEGNIIKHRT